MIPSKWFSRMRSLLEFLLVHTQLILSVIFVVSVIVICVVIVIFVVHIYFYCFETHISVFCCFETHICFLLFWNSYICFLLFWNPYICIFIVLKLIYLLADQPANCYCGQTEVLHLLCKNEVSAKTLDICFSVCNLEFIMERSDQMFGKSFSKNFRWFSIFLWNLSLCL